jgi:hypothetical protein
MSTKICTCHRIQSLAEPMLYRELLVRQPSKARKLLNALGHERAVAVRLLEVPCDPTFNDVTTVSELMTSATNLKELMFESPACNLSRFEEEGVWQSMADKLFLPFQQAVGGELFVKPLQKLMKRKSFTLSCFQSASASTDYCVVTLHINGPNSPYWTPDARSLPIFLHPTLTYLKVSCVNLPEDLFNEVKEQHLTPLKELILEECNITHQGLHGLLGLPKALEHLNLGIADFGII